MEDDKTLSVVPQRYYPRRKKEDVELGVKNIASKLVEEERSPSQEKHISVTEFAACSPRRKVRWDTRTASCVQYADRWTNQAPTIKYVSECPRAKMLSIYKEGLHSLEFFVLHQKLVQNPP